MEREGEIKKNEANGNEVEARGKKTAPAHVIRHVGRSRFSV